MSELPQITQKININLTKEEIEQLKIISKNLDTQDGASTRDPHYIVYELQEIVINDNYTMGYDTKSGYVMEDDNNILTKEELEEYCKDNDMEMPDTDNLDYITVALIPKFAAAFLTREEAENFISRWKYNLNKPYIYVESGYGNCEMQLIRKLLSAELLEKLIPKE